MGSKSITYCSNIGSFRVFDTTVWEKSCNIHGCYASYAGSSGQLFLKYSTFSGDGSAYSWGISPQGNGTTIKLDTCRFSNFETAVMSSGGDDSAGRIFIEGGLFEDCDTAIRSICNDMYIGSTYEGTNPSFLNCGTGINLASNRIVMAKSATFYFSGLTTEVQVDDVNTTTFAAISANKVIKNEAGGVIVYWDNSLYVSHVPPKVDMKVMSVIDISNPPTIAELDAAFGTATAVGAGFSVCINDNNAGLAVYTCTSDGTNWWTVANVKAT